MDKKKEALLKKAQQSKIVFEDLCAKLGIDPIPTKFIVQEKRVGQFAKACVANNPFPFPFSAVLVSKRVPGVNKLFENEKVLQTPAIAAVLSACSSVATEIGALRGDDVTGAETCCDVAFAGLQAIRLYMADYSGKAFRKNRFDSAVRVDNAWNGSFYKYRANDGRDVSFHVYYQSQQKKLAQALKAFKPYDKYNMLSISKDRKEIGAICSGYTAQELEDISFDCGCKIRDRKEWEATDVGAAVKAMPIVSVSPVGNGDKPSWDKPNSRGPLSGIKVLDLTHIIAGPACSRVLAEYGADVLLVRRGDLIGQEQAMLEFDGWAGKQAISLDFNVPEQLARVKELIKEADVITYSYQNGCMDKFGLSEEDIRKLNPNVIYANLMCFSDSVWKDRPGWAPCAEDITGLSVRNGTLEQPVNLNGVPLDYFPGMILALGTLMAVAAKLKDGGGYKVTTSLTRGAQYLHEVTDLCESATAAVTKSTVSCNDDDPMWNSTLQFVGDCATEGKAGFPSPATANTVYPLNVRNLKFTDNNTGWSQK